MYLAVINQLKMRSVYLLLFSLFFYYKTGGWYFSLLIFSTVVDYCLGWFIGKSEKNALRRFWLITSLVVNLALLGFFKYSYFIVGEVNHYFGTDFEAVNVFYWISKFDLLFAYGGRQKHFCISGRNHGRGTMAEKSGAGSHL